MPEPRANVFIFSGQGSQWPGMGRGLIQNEPVFREAVVACDRAIQSEAGWSVLETLVAGRDIDKIEFIQPALFTFQVALTALWRSLGIEPTAVVGHSMGEVAAAHAAGVLSLSDGARIICRRSAVLGRMRGEGGMLLIALSPKEVAPYVAPVQERVSIAAINGPRTVVLAGTRAELGAIQAAAEQRGVFCRAIKVDVASHSPQMDGLEQELIDALASVQPQPARQTIYSTVFGCRVDGTELGPKYWARNVREPVRFFEVLKHLAAEGYLSYLELSPHPLLVPTIMEGLQWMEVKQSTVVWSVRRGADERLALQESMARLESAVATPKH